MTFDAAYGNERVVAHLFLPKTGAAVLVAAGFYGTPSLPEVDPVNFAPRMRLPVLVINGRSDFVYPPATSQEPFFRALGTDPANKRRVVFETNHMPVRQELMRETLDWLDKYLGPVTKPHR